MTEVLFWVALVAVTVLWLYVRSIERYQDDKE